MYACSPSQCYAFFVYIADKKFWPMHVVKFVVIYCVCVWSTVCFSCTEAKPIPHQRQSNMNGTTGKLVK